MSHSSLDSNKESFRPSRRSFRRHLHATKYFPVEFENKCRRARLHASTSGRGSEVSARDMANPFASAAQRKKHIRPSRFSLLERQLSSKPSGRVSLDSPASHSSLQNGRTWSAKLNFDGKQSSQDASLDLLSQRQSQKESLLELLKQRTGSQEMSSQARISLSLMKQNPY